MRVLALSVAVLLSGGAAIAADPAPEITRPASTPQANGVLHTVRQIPEACSRLEGTFTGTAAAPYTLNVVRTSATCQPRARFVDAATAKPDVTSGWKLNDVIRIPSAMCPAQQAVVRVWRKPVEQAVALDGEGQSRIYLADAKKDAAAARAVPLPQFAQVMTVEGKACK